MPIPRAQLRLTEDELEHLLVSERTLHAATVSADGWPHVVPLWFVWHAGSVYVNNLKRSRRTRNLEAGSKVSLCVDTGSGYAELRGAVLYGRFRPADDDPALEQVRATFSGKYWGGDEVPATRSHSWLRLDPERIVSWDFRKIPSGVDPRLRPQRDS